MNGAERTYETGNFIRNGYRTPLGEIDWDLKDNRWLTWQFFKRNFVTMYRQSPLGVFWIFIVPLVSVGTFTVSKKSGLFSIGDVEVP